MAFHLKLIQPKELPADGLTSAEFKPWTNHLKNFLQQDVENFRFLKGGNYSTWSPAIDSESGKRILALHDDDPDHMAINAEPVTVALTEPMKQAKRARLLNTRNAQLSNRQTTLINFPRVWNGSSPIFVNITILRPKDQISSR